MKYRVWLLVAWAEAECLAQGTLPPRVQRHAAKLIAGKALGGKANSHDATGGTLASIEGNDLMHRMLEDVEQDKRTRREKENIDVDDGDAARAPHGLRRRDPVGGVAGAAVDRRGAARDRGPAA